ncbi:MAG: SDR family oxidoreductase [Sphingomonadaceae bacterium]|uniref:SDR family NAD(P)-dependent oxidoreductase n=1 Tax=Thermaurantiacus sp. TaxID=2820283 RepID=UPI00298F3297|nr:SDR family oxidoreductase [Thermaurantiacus sp.]MCS6987270.1 SDR family oxidoreductase [Sphingomonadaceae bacterium]MDW8414490.1 SDR family oxidoreductase [Thermaurantiacus sp.]
MGNLFDLTGQVAVVTGSSRGIGKAIAHRMAEHGAHVVVSSRKADACEAAVAEINAAVGRAAAVACPANISSKDDLARLARFALDRFGKVTALVCNAASNPYFGPMAGISDEQFTKILMNNVVSNHWLIGLLAPQMLERGEGSITLVSSIGAFRGSTVIGAYNVSKAADLQLVRNYAAEFGPRGVRVNAICPGLVKTDFARALWENPAILEQAVAGSCLKRIGQPDEIAGMAVFLAAPAGAFTTGQALIVDGGAMAV